MARQFHINVPDGVENEAAYIKAAQARIRSNALKGAHKRWLERSPVGAQRCIDFLNELGEFEGKPGEEDENGDWSGYKPHPLVKVSYGEFYSKMRASLSEYGALTEKQEAAVLAMIDRAQERINKRAQLDAEAAANSSYFGEVGARMVFTLTIQHISSFEGDFGLVTIYSMKNDAGQTFVYKGKVLWEGEGRMSREFEKGDKITIKATIKAHSEYRGVKQTVLNRPKVQS